MRNNIRSAAVILTFLSILSLGGCKQQQQMQQQIEGLEAKSSEAQKKMAALDGDLKKANFEITQLKALVTRLGNVVVDLQKAEEERAKAAEAARLAAATKSAGAKKKQPAKHRGH